MGCSFSCFSFSRTSDGGKTVGTIEVNLVKMGELEDRETDHITADTQDQKVEAQFVAQSSLGCSVPEVLIPNCVMEFMGGEESGMQYNVHFISLKALCRLNYMEQFYTLSFLVPPFRS